MFETWEQPVRLLDREAERGVLTDLIASVRAGRSRALVVRGEAGMGKTALLRHVPAAADGCRIVSTTGVESEMELPFAALHALCAPMLDGLDRLPGPQRDALATAFGLHAGRPPDRFLVGLAVLSLLADASSTEPVLCLVDDVQWLDRVSSETLAFVARRLLAERVGVIFAVRGTEPHDGLDGIPELWIEGLPRDDARMLLDAMIPGPLDEDVKARLLDEARGNPLALMELPRGVAPAELAGGFGLPHSRPLTSRIEQSFVQRIIALPRSAQVLLLIAAADPLGDVNLLWNAADRLGIDHDAARPAEAAGLIELGARVRFAHPLIRSAAHRALDPATHRDVRRALADVTDPVADPDRRAWHRAHATAAPDELVAVEMMRSADRAQARGGLAAAAAFLQRAAELTPDRATRVERFLAAAGAKLEVADAEAASDLLAAAELGPVDPLQRARLERLRAKVIFLSRRGRDAPRPLLDAARRLASLDLGLARETYLEALSSAMFAGRLNRDTSEHEVALAAAGVTTEPTEPTELVGLLLDGLVTRFTQGYADAVAPLSAALEMFRDEGRGAHADQWLWLACRLAQELWDDELWFELATLGVNVARETGALALLPNALNHLAALNVHAGAFSTAAALGDEVRLLVGAVGVPPLDYSRYKLAATRGDRSAINALYDSSIAGAIERGEGAAVGHHWALLALLHNGHGEYEQALDAATRGCEYDEVMAYNGSLVERIEAAVRSGHDEVAVDALDELSVRAHASGTAWGLGVEARSRALVHDDEAAYHRSIELLAPTRAAVDLARSRLVYGEWLRREGRRKDAREQLQAAHDSFDRMGADAFAARARRELVATGATARRLTADNRDALTPQELQVAQLARTGLTNQEIAARLYISPRTVEYHLGKVFRKLDVSTRRGLAAALDGSRRHAVPGYL